MRENGLLFVHWLSDVLLAPLVDPCWNRWENYLFPMLLELDLALLALLRVGMFLVNVRALLLLFICILPGNRLRRVVELGLR